MTIVSFSGIDGAGKSTQIMEFESWLRYAGLRTTLVTFWDDVVVLSRVREFLSYKIFKGDQGVGSPERPVNRRDKNVTSWLITCLRCCFYLLDALHLRWRVRGMRKSKTSKSGADVVIFDRYIYDELANLPLTRRMARVFVWVLLKLIPTPDVGYVIDADPAAARARKPEYPVEFLLRNREAYATLTRLAGDIAVIEPGPIEIVQGKIRQEMLRALWTGRKSALALSHS
ncbi:MAG: thymidylate kinase [Terriglobales bacterium]